MKALVFHGPRDIRYETFPDPRIDDDRNLVIRVQRCSICGSDLHIYHGAHLGSRDYAAPPKPFCTGHETIGEVVELGRAVREHRIGDRILISGGAGCGRCRRCRAGQFNQCEHARGGTPMPVYGTGGHLQGGHAEYLQVYNADLSAVHIPDGIDDGLALLLTDALATGYAGVRRADVKAGDTVAVIGLGPVGRMAVESALAVGAARVFAIDPVEARREGASALGAIPLHPDEARTHINEETRGIGVDAVIEAVGYASSVQLAIKLARLGGQVAVMGILQPEAQIPMHLAQMKSVSVHAGLAGVVDSWAELLPLVQAGRIRGNGVYSHQFSLAEGAEAFRLFDSRNKGVMKVMLTP